MREGDGSKYEIHVYTFMKVFMLLDLVNRLQNLVDISKLDRLSTIKLFLQMSLFYFGK